MAEALSRGASSRGAERCWCCARAQRRAMSAPKRDKKNNYVQNFPPPLACVSLATQLRPLYAQLPCAHSLLGRPFIYKIGATRGQHLRARARRAPPTARALSYSPHCRPFARRALAHDAAQLPAPPRGGLTTALSYAGAAIFAHALPSVQFPAPQGGRVGCSLAPCPRRPFMCLAALLCAPPRQRSANAPRAFRARSLRFPRSPLTKGMDSYTAMATRAAPPATAPACAPRALRGPHDHHADGAVCHPWRARTHGCTRHLVFADGLVVRLRAA